MSHACLVECILLASSRMWEPRDAPMRIKKSFRVAMRRRDRRAGAARHRQRASDRARSRRSPELQRLVDQAARRSPMVQDVDRSAAAIRTSPSTSARGTFPQIDLEGRVGILSTIGSHRYLVIELACGRTELAQMATLGHELFHALEIAADAVGRQRAIPWRLSTSALAPDHGQRRDYDVRNRSGGRGRSGARAGSFSSTARGTANGS